MRPEARIMRSAVRIELNNNDLLKLACWPLHYMKYPSTKIYRYINKWETEKYRKERRESMCVCVCVCERERERERERREKEKKLEKGKKEIRIPK